MTAKERHRLKLLEYLGNPENEFLSRDRLSVDVLGFVHRNTIYKSFSPAELTEIEKEALELRRSKYAAWFARVDMAQIRKAIDGDAAAAKLVYQRLEGWVPKQAQENTGANGGPIEHKITVHPAAQAILDKIKADVGKDREESGE